MFGKRISPSLGADVAMLVWITGGFLHYHYLCYIRNIVKSDRLVWQRIKPEVVAMFLF